jgi:hypothetical protein
LNWVLTAGSSTLVKLKTKNIMFYKSKIALAFSFIFFGTLLAQGQQTKHYNLARLLNENNLDTTSAQQVHVLDGDKNKAISAKGIVWLKEVNFKEGTIDVDLRGKDVFLQSFLGIAFHAKDTVTYDVIYFRPFRFRSTDIPTRKWSIQYMSMPDYDYDKLRKARPGVYENEVNPVPEAADWFHATIVIKGEWITVYVNHSATPSLKVKKLSGIADGKIGLWSSPGDLSGDFANFSISQ